MGGYLNPRSPTANSENDPHPSHPKGCPDEGSIFPHQASRLNSGSNGIVKEIKTTNLENIDQRIKLKLNN